MSDMATRQADAGRNRERGLATRISGVILVFCLSILARPLAAQETRPARDPLAAKEEIVRDRMAQLEDRMFRLLEKIAGSEPDQAERLRAALRRSRETLIRPRMEELVRLLDAGDFDEASERQKAVLRDLQAVLKLLTEDTGDDEQRRREIETLRAFRERIARLTAEEQEHRSRSEQAARQAGALRRIEETIQNLQSLIERERTAIERTDAAIREGRADGPAMATGQADIRKDADKLAAEVAQLAPTPASTQAASRPGQAPGPREPYEDLNRAAARMQDAEPHLNDGRFDKAKPNQQRAAESLQNALRRLREQAEEMRREIDFPKMADAQQGTADRAEQLAGDMSGQAASRPASGPADRSDESQADGRNDARPPTPGQENVGRAGRHMQNAARDLQQGKPGDAGAEQQKALDQLAEAQRQLEDSLNQMRREQQEELLRAMEDRFREMLARQLPINQGTIDLDRKGPDRWTRAEELLAGTLARGEHDLASDAVKALDILRQEGTTLVFPQIVRQLAADLRMAGDRLGARNTGAGTQQLQADIAQTLQELIDAVQEMRKKIQSGQAPGGSGGPQQTPPLLPGSAELKLLRACQVRVTRQTEAFHQERHGEKELSDDLRERLERIAERQKEIGRMAQELNERSANR